MTAAWVWLGGTAAYLVLAGQVSVDEVVAGIILGGLGVAWHAIVCRCSRHSFTFERRAGLAVLLALVGLPGAILRVGLRLSTALVRDVQGHTVEQPFHRGRLDDINRRPTDKPNPDVARRAIVVLATSLAPDSYVLRLPVDEETILIHAITRQSSGTDPRWPA